MESKTTLTMQSILRDIKDDVSAEDVGNYSAKDIMQLWRQLQPELTEEFINKCGEKNVQLFVDVALQYIRWDNISKINFVVDERIINCDTLKKYITEFKTFLNQVVPLYTYQMANRITPRLVDYNQFSVKNVYDTPKDGCFYGVGDERNTYDPYGIDCEECKKTGGKPKANGAYVWGMVSDGEQLYWSTNNNYLCMPGYGQIATVGSTGAVENSCWVCEYDKGMRAKELSSEDPTLAKYGDIVPPRIFSYNPKTGVVTDITPDESLLKYSQGLRSAAYHKGVVFFGGPNFSGADVQQSSSSTFLAYSPERGEFLGSSSMSSVSGCTITNVRRWIVVNDVLYCGVGLIKDGVAGGGVMRWNGSVDDPFNFEIVAYTPAEAAEIEYHNGHIYVGGWPITKFGQTVPEVASALYKSPEVPEGGFTAANATTWPKVWEYNSYESNPTSVGSTYFSVMKSFKGRLYWGMFSGTYGVLYGAQRRFGTLKSAEAIAYVLGSLRATTLFSAEDVNDDNDVQMLYGERKLPAYDTETKKWSIVDNKNKYVPRWGRSGYGNLFTCYTWSMAKYNDKLFVGTMDMSDLIDPTLEEMTQQEQTASVEERTSASSLLNVLKDLMGVDSKKYGYECLMLQDQDTEPEYVTDNGFGNPAAYAIRNMEVCNNKMFIGTANPLNLHEEGGWQILSLEENCPTSITAPTMKAASLMFKQNEYYMEFSSMKGEKIQNITFTDLSGNTVTRANYDRTLATVITSDMPKGIYVVSIKTDTDNYRMKVSIK